MKFKFASLFPLLVIGCGPDSQTGPEYEGNASNLPLVDFPLLGEARPIDLIDMKLEFPESLKKLDGRQVSLVGFMAPFDISS